MMKYLSVLAVSLVSAAEFVQPSKVEYTLNNEVSIVYNSDVDMRTFLEVLQQYITEYNIGG
jgi:hypothetical protein